MQNRRRAFFGALALSAALVNGCAEPSQPEAKEPSTTSSAATQFRGVYSATNGGPIAVIAFLDANQYLLMNDGCREQSCAELGTFQYDAARAVLSLTNGATSATRTLPVKVLATRNTSNGGDVQPRDFVNPYEGGLVGGGSGGGMVSTGNDLLDVILNAIIDGIEMSRDNDSEDPEQKDDEDDGENDDGTDVAANCFTGIPTGHTAPNLVAAYWARCPQGPQTRA